MRRVNFTEGERDSCIYESAWGVIYLLKYTRPVSLLFRFVKALEISLKFRALEKRLKVFPLKFVAREMLFKVYATLKYF